jgi:hypothetical protein
MAYFNWLEDISDDDASAGTRAGIKTKGLIVRSLPLSYSMDTKSSAEVVVYSVGKCSMRRI